MAETSSAEAELKAGVTVAPTAINDKEKSLATIVYVLQVISLFVGVTSIIGVIMNYVKRGELTDEVIKAHFSWQIRTFWWSLVFSVICLILTTVTFGIGGISFIFLAIFYIYRVVKGWMRLNDGKAV